MTQREAFETWAKSQYLDTDHKEKDAWGREQYSPHIHSMWQGWQAAQAQAAVEPVGWFIDVTTGGRSIGDYQVAAREHWGDRSVCVPLYTSPPDHREAMRLALEALNSCTPGDWSTGHVIDPYHDEKLVDAAIAALEGTLG